VQFRKQVLKRWLLAGICFVMMPVVFARAATAEENVTAPRAEIERMSPTEKEQLRRRHERFLNMTSEQRQRLHDLHTAIEVHAESAELRQVMRRYYQWLKTLEPMQREELLQLEPSKRLERVKQLLREQETRIARGLGFRDSGQTGWARRTLQGEGFQTWTELDPRDRRAVHAWVASLSPENLPPSLREQFQQAEDPHERRRILVSLFFRRPWDRSEPLPPLANGALADLRAQLSADARRILEQRDDKDQLRLVASWVRLTVMFEFVGRRGGLGFGLPAVSDAELAEFLEKKIDASTRDRLLAMPPDEMANQLRRLYLLEHARESPGPGGGQPGQYRPRRGGFGPQPRGRRGPERASPPNGGKRSPPGGDRPFERPVRPADSPGS
jgi:hypothetical protein